MQWVMFDLETLDTAPTTVILSLGAVKFNPKVVGIPESAPRLSLKFDIDEQSLMGRTISEGTIEWWSKQDPKIQEAAFSDEGRTSLTDAVEQFHKFVWNSDMVVSQGSFDVNIMENLYAMLKKTVPWKYWQVADSRTLFNFIDGSLNRATGHHDAVEDALQQALAMQRALRKINWQGKPI